MSRISDLRNNENNCVNLVNIMELFCNGETKYVEMLLKLFKTSGDSTEIKVNAISNRMGIEVEKLKQLNGNEIEILFYMADNMMLLHHLSVFQRFCKMNELNQIEKNDLHSYKNFDEVADSVIASEEKIKLKELEKQINKIYEDDDWLILIPQTYEASVKYGYNTKWCTASEKTSEQFVSYTRDGVLIYIIHKGVEKVAVYKKYSNSEISFWNEKDTKTDSFSFNFPLEIMKIIRETIESYSTSTIQVEDYGKYLNVVTGSTGAYFGMDDAAVASSSMRGFNIGIDPAMQGSVKISKNSTYGTFDHPEIENTLEKWSKTGLLEGLEDNVSLSSRGQAIAMASLAEQQAKKSQEIYESIKSKDIMSSPEFVAKVKGLMKRLV